MGSPYSSHDAVADAKKLGKDIYQAAKALAPMRTAPGGEKAYGGSPDQPRRLEAGLAPLLRPHHKADIYAGMVREVKTYGKGTQAKYFTFRTISTTVREGWFRTIEARHYAQKVADFAADLASRAFKDYLEAQSP